MVGIVDKLDSEVHLSAVERTILQGSGVRSAEDVHSLLTTFPSLATNYGVRSARITSAVMANVSAVYSNFLNTPRKPTEPELGAIPPTGVTYGLGTIAGIPPLPSLPITAPTVVPGAGAVDLRLSKPWPVRDQGRRGTCVAFGAAACVEHLLSPGEPPNPDFSEQFLYHLIKTASADPNHSTDGTWLQFARDMLQRAGICHEPLHPYIYPGPINPVCGPVPSLGAIADSTRHVLTTNQYLRKPSSAAATLLLFLQKGQPVAASFPVFADPTDPSGATNWTSPTAWSYGRVFDPPLHAVVKGGHCVCVTGFVRDNSEPTGGYFVFRNSWGLNWASAAPSPGNTVSPEQGYGEISATYVDTYCWEFLQL